VKYVPQNVAQLIFSSKIIPNFFWEKEAKKLEFFGHSQKIVQMNKGPNGENSPNLVTLPAVDCNDYCLLTLSMAL
jgi:hypothetical protein